jgi:hypothetical protein
VDFYMRGANPALKFDDLDVRMTAYRALLAGAAGHTYGNNNIWQMWGPGREPRLGADTPWKEALDHPGAFQMRHLRRLFESRPWELLVPHPARGTEPARAIQVFTPPSSGRGCDWVLVLDDASRKYPAPAESGL